MLGFAPRIAMKSLLVVNMFIFKHGLNSFVLAKSLWTPTQWFY